MSSIFLSHNHRDKPFVRMLASDLAGEGIRVWIDEAELEIGDSLLQKIRDGIDEMEFVGVVLSKFSVESEWVKKEVDIAMNQEIEGRRVKVLPLVVDECELPGFLKGKLYADFRSSSNYHSELRRLLRRLLGKKTQSRVSEQSSAQKESGGSSAADAETVATLIRSLVNDADSNVRGTSAVALGKLGAMEAVAALVQALLHDSRDSVRGAAAYALGQIGDSRAKDALLAAATHDASAPVRGTAIQSLGQLRV